MTTNTKATAIREYFKKCGSNRLEEWSMFLTMLLQERDMKAMKEYYPATFIKKLTKKTK